MGVFSLLCYRATSTGTDIVGAYMPVLRADSRSILTKNSLLVFLTLQRRRKIDRSMIGQPTNFKVSSLFCSVILSSQIETCYFN